ncbi:hypothetical protein VTO42DRAFT_3379 [Malbranchea cinnamomea]
MADSFHAYIRLLDIFASGRQSKRPRNPSPFSYVRFIFKDSSCRQDVLSGKHSALVLGGRRGRNQAHEVTLLPSLLSDRGATLRECALPEITRSPHLDLESLYPTEQIFIPV